MAKKIESSSNKIKNGIWDLKKRILFVIVSLIIFRIGSFISIPGINTVFLSKMLMGQKGTIIDMFNTFSGGALSRASIFSLGIMPYISASIIVQLLTLANSKLAEIKKDGEIGKRKINRYTRYMTLLIAFAQAISIAITLPNIPEIHQLIIHVNYFFYTTTVFSLVTGTMFLMWLGELITNKGIGNGISLIIFTGIISNFPSTIAFLLKEIKQNYLHGSIVFLIICLSFLITFLVVFIEKSQRKIIVHYPRRQKGRRMYIAQSTHLPLKINMAGVIPAIFASSIILFPTTIASWFGLYNLKCMWLKKIIFYLQPNHFLYLVLYSAAIVFFCFFYTGLVFNSRETANNLKRSGAFISGIRPGEQTAKYIDKISDRLTLMGSVYITFICLFPELIRNITKIPFNFGGTSLLIIVLVIMDFISQIQTFLMSAQYDLALKKANFYFKK
ncbi:preprotein translocase subunit SecY [Buchnera aphidicola]|uniref:preprotein translocase subunit SecY n=1 Tax=Buchnera aphidicola TaxID=9 RepID=UPI003463C7FB